MGDELKKDELDVTVFEKSFDDSVEALSSLLNGKPGIEDMEKAKRKKAKEDDDEESVDLDAEDGEDEDEAEEEEKVKKSLSDTLAEVEEVAEAMDVEPFLRELAKAIDERFQMLNKNINVLKKSIAYVESLAKSQGKLLLTSAELMKATSETVEKIGETPIPSTSVLRKGGDRFPESTEGKRMGREEILSKALELKTKGKLSVTDVTKIEGRLNKGLPLEDSHRDLIMGVVN